MKPLYGHSGSWIDEKSTFSMEAEVVLKNRSVSGSGIDVNNVYQTEVRFVSVLDRAHSFPRQNLTNSAANLVNSAAHHGNTDEIPWLTAAPQVKFRGLIKSLIDKSNKCY